MDWKAFAKSLAMAAAGGAAVSTADVLQGGNVGLKHLGTSAAAGALVGVVGLWLKSPAVVADAAASVAKTKKGG